MNTQTQTWNKGYNPEKGIVSMPVDAVVTKIGEKKGKATVWFQFPIGNENLPFVHRHVELPVAKIEAPAHDKAIAHVCSVAGCTKKIHAGGMCRHHYDAKRRAKK